MSANGQTGLTVYPLAHYKFGKKGAKIVKDESQEEHFDRLRAITEIEGLRRKLVGKLSPETESLMADWEVGECIGSFWRPNHHPSVYPYSPAHITNPKEVVKLYIVPLRERCFFAVPEDWELIAVPLHELHQNMAKFGPYIAAVPYGISRFRLTLVD